MYPAIVEYGALGVGITALTLGWVWLVAFVAGHGWRQSAPRPVRVKAHLDAVAKAVDTTLTMYGPGDDQKYASRPLTSRQPGRDGAPTGGGVCVLGHFVAPRQGHCYLGHRFNADRTSEMTAPQISAASTAASRHELVPSHRLDVNGAHLTPEQVAAQEERDQRAYGAPW